jgi:hypothetical protein
MNVHPVWAIDVLLGLHSFQKPFRKLPVVKKYLRIRLGKIDEYLADRDMRVEGRSDGFMQSVNVADCVLFSLLEYAKEAYGRGLTEGFPKLGKFYESFGKRGSAKVEGGCPEEMLRKSLVWAEGSY